MAKIDSINKYKEEFLAGKSPSQIEKFNKKDIDRQYASIMTWRHKQRREKVKSTSSTEIIDHLRLTRTKIASLPSLSMKEIDALEKELQSLISFLNEWRMHKREEEIKLLEDQQLEIARKLKELKGNTTEPSLFD